MIGKLQTFALMGLLLGLPCTVAYAQPQDTRYTLEMRKLAAEVSKAEFESRYPWLGYLAPIGAVASATIAVFTVLYQRGSSLKVQQNVERANLELKVLELVLGSPTPDMGLLKLSFARECYPAVLSPAFLQATANIKRDDLPGTRLHEIKLECFKQLAQKANSRAEIVEAAHATFPGDRRRLVDADYETRIQRSPPVAATATASGDVTACV